MKSPRAALGFAIVTVLALVAPERASCQQPSPELTQDELGRFVALAGQGLFLSPLAPAEGLGITGFEIYAGASVTQVDEDEPEWHHSFDGEVYAGHWPIGRAGVRKGLPWGIDIGVAAGQDSGGDSWAGGEVKWAFVRGGNITPAVAARLAYVRLLDNEPLDLQVLSADVLVSKGFAVVTPYLGAGVLLARGELTDPDFASFDRADEEVPYALAGVRVTLWVPQLTAEIVQGETTTYAIKVAVGF